MSATARKAGTETVGGRSLPPGPITNVAGTRTLVEPPADRPDPGVAAGGFVVLLRVEAGGELLLVELDDVVVLVAAAWELVLVVRAVDEVGGDELLDPPQAASSSVSGSNVRNRARALTSRSIDAD